MKFDPAILVSALEKVARTGIQGTTGATLATLLGFSLATPAGLAVALFLTLGMTLLMAYATPARADVTARKENEPGLGEVVDPSYVVDAIRRRLDYPEWDGRDR